MTRKEAERLARQRDTLQALGFTYDEAESLRRISMTLHRWHALECGDGNAYADWCIERAENGEPFMVRHVYAHDGKGGATKYRTRIPDRERGAHKRLAAIMKERNERLDPGMSIAERVDHLLFGYVQTDPRGAALYILRPGDVPEGQSADAYYTRGICVY